MIDISNISNPLEVGYCYTSELTRLMDVTVVEKYGYAIDEYTGLRIIDVSNPFNPQEVGIFRPDWWWAYEVIIKDNYAYVSEFSGLRIIDISDSYNPQEVSTFTTRKEAQGLAIIENYAYLTERDTGLHVIDISNPLIPLEVGFLNIPGDFLYDVACNSNYAYVTGSEILRIIDVLNINNLQEVGFIETRSLAHSVALSDGFAFVADYYAGLCIIDINNPSNPREIGYFDTGDIAYNVTVSNNFIFVTDKRDGLYIFELINSPPVPPTLIQPNMDSIIRDNILTSTWSVPKDIDGNTLHFKVEIANDNSFIYQIPGSPFESQISTIGFNPIPPVPQGIGNCSYTLQDSLNDGTYYWRVSACDSSDYGPTSTIFKFTIDIEPPAPPINLLANGANPSPWQQINDEFIITWENPIDSSGIARYFYKLGSSPKDNYDTTATINANSQNRPRFIVKAEKEFGDTLYVWLEDGAGNVDYYNSSSVILLYYTTVPSVKFTFPKPDEKISHFVIIRATISDFILSNYILEYKLASQSQWNDIIPDTIYQSYDNQFICVWENTVDSGSMLLRLTIKDSLGNTAKDSVQFVLNDPDQPMPIAIILPLPNYSYLNGEVSIKGYAFGQGFSQYSLFLKSKNQTYEKLLYESYVPKKNEELFSFDTPVHADDEYTLFLSVKNAFGNQKDDYIPIIIDNTSPWVQLTAPLSDTIDCTVQIEGEFKEKHLKSINLTACEEGKTDTTNLKPIVSDSTFFKGWETIDLNGNYYLYLSLEDSSGLNTKDTLKYYIYNPLFEKSIGLEKRKEEFSLYIPPNGYKSAVICIDKKSIGNFGYDPLAVNPTKFIAEIHSNIDEKKFFKPAIFKIDYGDIDVNKYDENKLGVFHWENDGWHFVGGTVDKAKKVISTAIEQIGVYGLFERLKIEDFIAKDLKLVCQPRVFSPRGGGYNNETNISFNLEKYSFVTIKIFNLAGRLVKILCENKPMTIGAGNISWNGLDNEDRYCVSGLYVVLFQAGGKEATQTVMVLNK